MNDLYKFQAGLLKKVEKEFKQSNTVILAACVASGKTTMANAYIKRNRREFKKILVLAHGQDVLRTQFGEVAQRFHKDVYICGGKKRKEGLVDFSSVKDNETGIFVTLPQTIHRIESLGHFDLVVVDEAHEFYPAPMVQNILRRLSPDIKQLLLSATPFRLRKETTEGSREFVLPEVKFYLEQALELDVISNVYVETLVSAYDYDLKDINNKHNLKKETKFSKKDVESTLDLVLTELFGRLSHRKTWQSSSSFLSRLDKTMLVCSGIHHANQVANYCSKHKIPHIISHSEEEIERDKLEQFKTDAKINFLIVVYRCRLGYDMPELVNTVDMSGTLNPTLIYQISGRLTRNHPKSKKKRFFKMTPHRLHHYTHAVTCVALSMGFPGYFDFYMESDLLGIKLPKGLLPPRRKDPKEIKEKVPRGPSTPRDKSVKRLLLDFAKVCKFLKRINFDAHAPLDRSAYTTLGEVRTQMREDRADPDEIWQSLMEIGASGGKKPF